MISLERLTPARVGVVSCVVVAIATVAVQLPRAIGTLGDRAGRNASFSYEDREFGAGNSIIPDKQLLFEARALIPSDGAFHVATGSAPIADERGLTRLFADNFATSFLMPRRPSQTARWIICLGCDPGSPAAMHARVVWSNHKGSMLLERVAR